MIFSTPIWLLLLLPLGAAWWFWRQPTPLLRALRALSLLLVLLALARPALKLPSETGTVVVLADRSASMPAEAEAQELAAVKLLGQKMDDQHQLALVSFGTRAVVEQSPGRHIPTAFSGEIGPDQSQLAEAIDTALGLVQPGQAARFVVLSDGRWTGVDPGPAAARAAAADIPIDYQLVQRSAVNDLGIEKIDAPDTVRPAESFMVTAQVQSPREQEVRYQLVRGKKTIASGTRLMESGRNTLMFRDQADKTGVFGYRLSITPVEEMEDPVPDNNRGKFLVGVEGPRPVLHATEDGASGLAALLQEGGLDLNLVDAGEMTWDLETLAQYSAVILEDVRADDLRNSGMRNLAAWVAHAGTGLMFTGGQNSYGRGGYYKSPMEPVMPVTMELRQEHRKLSLAIVVVLDRSGSMCAPAGLGKTKMDLANLGTAEVYDLMTESDEIGVIAVDSAPHTIVPIRKKGAGGGGTRNKILKMESMGGGIFVYSGLLAGAKMLQKATAGTRHIILFADAADAEQPGKYRELLKKCSKEGITVSVIGLGSDKDPDAAFLRDVAKRGNGEVYFTRDAKELPRLFAQDTFTVARSTFIEDPTPFSFTPEMRSISDKLPNNAPGLGGYNLTYLRPQADLGAVTTDDYKAPVVAKWYVGAGRVLCYTGEADGKFARPMADWDQVGGFYNSLARWTAGEVGELPPEMMLTHKVRRGNLVVELMMDPARTEDPFTGVPEVSLLRGLPGGAPQSSSAKMAWVDADRLSLEVPLTGKETAIASVEIPGFKRMNLSPVCLPYSEEFKPTPSGTGKRNLQAIARATGGEMRLDVGSMWKTLPKRPQFIEFGQWLALAALLFFLLEILERRTGLVGGRDRKERTAANQRVPKQTKAPKTKEHRKRRPAKQPKATPKPAAQPVAPAATKAPAKAEKAVEAKGTFSALKAARKRAEDRNRRR